MNFNLHVLVLLCLVLYFAFMKSVYFHSTDTCMQIITGTYVYSLLLKRVIAWERSHAVSGYGIIWGDADRNKQGGI